MPRIPKIVMGTPAEDVELLAHDALHPQRIEHKREVIRRRGGEVEASCNYLDYFFETETHWYRARAYLDDMTRVAIFGPFELNAPPTRPVSQTIDARVLAYLRRRYATIEVLDETGYREI